MHVRFLPATLLLTVAVPAQDFIHYRFDSNCTNEVINLATGTSALASNGLLETNSTGSAYVPGVFGDYALSGGSATTNYNRVRTGWDPGTQPITGDFTLSFFLKERTASTSLVYLMGAPSGGFRLFTNGIAGNGLYQREIFASGGNGQNGRDFQLPASVADIRTLAAGNWVHVAMVVDATAQTADWYVNGTSVLRLTGVPGVSITLAGPFTVGYYSSASLYDIDEFLISLRAYSAAEILALSQAPKAGAGQFDSGIASQCGAGNVMHDHAGGDPTIGNTNYALTVQLQQQSFWAVLFGFSRCTYGGGAFPLPLDAGTLSPIASGCWLLTDVFATSTGVGGPGLVTLPLPIPNDPSYVGVELYSQAVAVDSTNTLSASEGVLTAIGR